MVLGVNEAIVLEKAPVPEPSVVLLFAIVGDPVVFQHTPLEVTAEPFVELTFPPPLAVFD